MDRKDFLQKSAAGAAAILLPRVFDFAASTDPEPYNATIVKDFVIAGHGNFDKVKSMLADYPNLLYACYDWGNGDFETALEGAGHVGNAEIADYLIGQGARANIFVLTMLGKTELVKPVLEAWPSLINSKGPHGLTLLHHAQKGGKNAEILLKYIQGKGLTETQIKIK